MRETIIKCDLCEKEIRGLTQEFKRVKLEWEAGGTTWYYDVCTECWSDNKWPKKTFIQLFKRAYKK